MRAVVDCSRWGLRLIKIVVSEEFIVFRIYNLVLKLMNLRYSFGWNESKLICCALSNKKPNDLHCAWDLILKNKQLKTQSYYKKVKIRKYGIRCMSNYDMLSIIKKSKNSSTLNGLVFFKQPSTMTNYKVNK